MALTLRSTARSDVGLVRQGNEDSGYAGPHLLVVADGMGGHAAGEVASAAAVEVLAALEADGAAADGEEATQALASAMRMAHERIQGLVEDDPSHEGMGTTVTAAMWAGGSALAVAHIGDSRAYLLRAGNLRRVTHDHTFVQTLVDEGRISEAEAGTHPARSLLLRTLDGRGEPDPDLLVLQVQAGDRLLLCSDGLSGVVTDPTIRDVLAGRADLEEAADTLVELALKGGAPDNVTVVLADVVEADEPPEGSGSAAAGRGEGGGERDGRGGPAGQPPGGAGVDQPTGEVPLVAVRRAAAGVTGTLVGAAAPDPKPRGTSRRHRGRLGRREESGRAASDGEEDAGRERLLGHDAEDDPETLRYAPRPPRRYVRLRRVAIFIVAAALAYLGVSLVLGWLGEQYYVGERDGQVAVFRGVSQTIGPIGLSELLEPAGDLPVEALPEVFRARVTDTIPADDLAGAREVVDRLRAQACAAHPPEPASAAGQGGTEPQATPSPTATPGFPGLDCPEEAP